MLKNYIAYGTVINSSVPGYVTNLLLIFQINILHV